jgi:hypothetical protein
MERTHYGQHPDCFGCKVLGVNFAPSAMPSRRDGAHCAIAKDGDKQLSKDLATFKGLREKGYNPKHIDGITELEKRVETGFELEHGMSMQDMAKTTPSARRGDADARRDIAKGAPEFSKRAIEAHEHFQKQDATKPGEITV